MRAFGVRRFGEAPAIHDLSIPAADIAFLIRVTYAGINPIDYKLLEKLTATSAYPFVMGIDFAGVVERFRPAIAISTPATVSSEWHGRTARTLGTLQSYRA